MSDQHLFPPLTPAALTWADKVPVSTAFSDSYFSRDDGPAETTHVFLDGNALATRFAALPDNGSFTLAETGFGTGLTALLVCEAFLAHAPASATLHLFSVEKHPLDVDTLEASHGLWPSLAAIAAELRRVYPPLSPGLHRRWLFGGRVGLTLAFGDAAQMLSLSRFKADAWCLDGFAPDRNPGMWHDGLYKEIGRLSKPGTTLASFTAAGHVRRALAAQGFDVTRTAGFGRKRHMTQARRSGEDTPEPAPPVRVIAIAGAGLAGATCARALAERGHQVLVFDPAPPASGASGNHAGILYTTPSAHPTPQNRFYQASYLHALHWLDRYRFPATGRDGALNGVKQFPADERHRKKAADALQSGQWDSATLCGDPAAGTLVFPGGGHLSPPRWCRHLLDHPGIELITKAVTSFHHEEDGVTVVDSSGLATSVSDLILANAAAAAQLAALPTELRQIRGQVTHVRATDASEQMDQALCHAGYVSPAIDGMHCVGATFNLRETNPLPTDTDDAANLALLKRHLPEVWQQLGGDDAALCGHRVGFRCQSNDYLPLAGALPSAGNCVWLTVAHGSRGLASTTLCAEIIAAAINNEPAPADSGILAALDPMRFVHRQHRKRRPR